MGVKDKIKSVFNKRIKIKTTIPCKEIVTYNTGGISISKCSKFILKDKNK